MDLYMQGFLKGYETNDKGLVNIRDYTEEELRSY